MYFVLVSHPYNMNQWFYAVLPSNASGETFPENKLHTYRIQIPSPLPSNDGKWCVGMTEIQFPSSWPNIIKGAVTVRWRLDTPPISFLLPDGNYNSIDELLDTIQSILNNANLKDKIVIHYDKLRNRVLMVIKEPSTEFGIAFSQNIANILGFNRSGETFYTRGKYMENLPADINDGLYAIYVYADIVEKRLVGDAMVPLLRVVPTEPKSNHNNFRWVRFKNVEYIPVVKNHSDTIEINIRRDNGEIVPFENGKVVVTLHFKKLSS